MAIRSLNSFLWSGLFALAAIAVVALATREVLHAYRHVYEPYARVAADFTVLSSSVNGNIETIHAEEGQRIESGQKLASMRSDVESLDVRTFEAELAREQAVRAQIEAELDAFQSELDDEIVTARESVLLLRQELSTLTERQAIAQASVDRNNELLGKSAVSRQRIDDAQDKLLDITREIRALETGMAMSDGKLKELQGRKSRGNVYRSRLEVVDRNIAKLEVLVAQSRQRLSDMDIYSPIDAIVNEIYVRPGAYVEDGTEVFLLHDPDRLWIEADVDETDIRHVRAGQDVLVELDAYPYEHFPGTVRSIGHVTVGSKRAGNGDAKAARAEQKIRVVIDFPPIGKSVWPGMRAAASIVIR